jgi:hypothetical protein
MRDTAAGVSRLVHKACVLRGAPMQLDRLHSHALHLSTSDNK